MTGIIKSCLFIIKKLQYLRTCSRIKRLVNNGMQLGENVTIMPSVRIDDEYAFLIKIGNNCSLSHRTNILAHDATAFKLANGHTRLQKVILHDNVFIGNNVIILPGCTIGPNVVIAAGSVVNKDIPPNSCVAGVPARRYQSFDDFLKICEKQIGESGVIHYEDLAGGNYLKSREWVLKVIEEKGIAYVRGFTGKFPYTFNGSDFH